MTTTTERDLQAQPAARMPVTESPQPIELAEGWAGDLLWCGGAFWVAWAACLDPEPEILAESHWDWPLKREQPLRPGSTPEDWRRRSREAVFTVSLGRVEGGTLARVRELSRTDHAVEGPALAAIPGSDQPAVLWGERRAGGSVLLAQVSGSEPELVAEAEGAMLGPRLATDATGRLVAVWQQWPSRGEPSEDPQIMAAVRSHLTDRPQRGEWSRPDAISPQGQSAWAPAVARDAGGRLWCAWDGWNGKGYAVYLRTALPDGTWQETTQVSPPDSRHFHIAPDVAPGSDSVWIVWSSSSRWGETNHRFNHIRHLHAAEAKIGSSGEILVRPAPGNREFGQDGELPVPVVPFTHSVEEEFVNPLMPKVRFGADHRPVVLYRQFRSVAFKDFGWSIWALRLEDQRWTEPALLTQHTGFPDTPYGVASIPMEAGQPSSGEAGAERWWLVYHAGDFPRLADRHPSRPVRHHRLVVESVHTPASPTTPTYHPGAGGTRSNGPVAFHKAPVASEVEARRADAQPGTAEAEQPPPEITTAGRTYTLLYGDLHRHSAYSKCMSANDGDPLDHWRWVQDVGRLDFYALTEHLEYMSFVEWRRIEDLAERLAAGGRVLALAGWELAIPPGHTNFFYADQQIGRDLRIACLSSQDLAAVWPKLDAWIPPGKAVAIRHHQGHRGDDLAHTYAPQWEPVVEIIQTRGEYPDWVQSLWRQGFRVGVVGASDHSRGAPFVQGLTGLWLPPDERTREGVIAGLHARRTFATNGVRMSVFVSASGQAPDTVLGMGERGTLQGRPTLRVDASGTSRIEAVEFYRNGRLVHVAPPESATSATVQYVDDRAPVGEHAYWVRVTQGPERNGRRPHRGVAYSSPIWVTVEPERRGATS